MAISSPTLAAEPRAPRQADRFSADLPKSVRAEQILAQKPNDRGARLEAARSYLAEGADTPSKVEAAQQHAIFLLNQNANDVEALLIAGQTALLEGDAASAARYYRTATLADPNNATAFLSLGDALSRGGDESGSTVAFARYRALMGMPALQVGTSKR